MVDEKKPNDVAMQDWQTKRLLVRGKELLKMINENVFASVSRWITMTDEELIALGKWEFELHELRGCGDCEDCEEREPDEPGEPLRNEGYD